jgi:hypothetical protein
VHDAIAYAPYKSKLITNSTYQWFYEWLNHFLRTHPIAKTTGLEMGFRLTLPGSTKNRRPDLGVVLNSNSVPLIRMIVVIKAFMTSA